ncbi:hypothetical protein CN878_02645 [Ochrobactrum sp. 695/2009]|nr:hypothetical protein [Brucella intermedia]PJR89982.1 hypothetical protein CN881_12370 [Ochrobactrum sp. 721/2009]PJT14199.1 hypothetical protein CN880_21400 [Ochrobactrum sp. 720/2009]PJT24368.1 hypothetical protein CN879_08430 [Ochrobactrum sp. 715/2009]PJT30307.1 hypothetical protein CN878_02645 [Ochrobactrum sp. 695/2009]PJT33834.1 hypothetical protein CN877_09540 [Ochrobactrum sp. 689/2009]
MKSIFIVMKQVSPDTARPYRVIETYPTSEGMRSRIVSGAFSTQELAQQWVEHLQEGSES